MLIMGWISFLMKIDAKSELIWHGEIPVLVVFTWCDLKTLITNTVMFNFPTQNHPPSINNILSSKGEPFKMFTLIVVFINHSLLHSIQNLIYKLPLQNEMIINILVVSSRNSKWSLRAVNQGRLSNKQDFYKFHHIC